ncbi:hypothetical protein J2T13_004534 [Paenibacillus sp. DS2015]
MKIRLEVFEKFIEMKQVTFFANFSHKTSFFLSHY